MAAERTLAIIKPDALEKGVIGQIVNRMEENDLKVVAMRMMQLSKEKAEGFYAVHKDKPFFGELVTFMTSGPVVVMCLEGKDAVAKWRTVMGATDPSKAAEGTVRADFGTDIQCNATHGSDAAETAKQEIAYFFENSDIVKYEWN
ncbi:MAG: nucleoside-diphosphate kinase [Deltaproteobacteria bacterium CG11_big_fil_rev_8_21_14_0_20_47_16]|nr:MAG: nucleoside-diphosphate kinase [Deltaproteobacteria bacterium CG11_big_fil_rev_8_21_14_0_20_47_16]